MSAFLCSAAHISAVVNAASVDALRWAHIEREEAFTLLANANAKSVDYRYNEADSSISVSGYRHDIGVQVSLAEALKAIACLEYQSCEVPEWDSTPAAQLLVHIRADIITRLPGYAAAPWGIAERPHTGAVLLTSLVKREPSPFAKHAMSLAGKPASSMTPGQKAAETRRKNAARRVETVRDARLETILAEEAVEERVRIVAKPEGCKSLYTTAVTPEGHAVKVIGQNHESHEAATLLLIEEANGKRRWIDRKGAQAVI